MHLRLLCPLALLSLLPACATIIEGTSQNVTLITDPPGASCTVDRAGQQVGVVAPTPGTLRVDKSGKDLQITCLKDGMGPGSATHASHFVGTTFGNLIAGGLIGIVVDASSGANFTYPGEIRVALQPVAPVMAPVSAPMPAPGPAPIVLQPPAPGAPAS